MIQLPVSGYSQTELEKELADYKADLAILHKAKSVCGSYYFSTSDLNLVIKDLEAGLAHTEEMLKALSE